MKEVKDMVSNVINARKNRAMMTTEFIKETKNKLDVFLMNNRITQTEYESLIKELDSK